MSKTKYDLLVRNGKERFLVIPEADFKAMQERLEDDADFRAIETSKIRQAKSPRVPSAEVRRELGIIPKRPKQKA